MKLFLVFILLLSCIVFCSNAFAKDGEAPKWKVELDEAIQSYNFLQEGKFLFFTNAEYLWLYDTKSGEKVYNLEIDDFEKEGIHQLVGELYLVSAGDAVQCFDAVKGQKLWESEFDGISQSDFTDIGTFDQTVILRYGDDHIAVDLANGKELWRSEIEYNGSLVERGTFNYMELIPQNRLMVMLKGDEVGLYDISNGKLLLQLEDYEINGDLIQKGNPWRYRGPEDEKVLLVLDDGAAVIDVKSGKEMARREISIDGDYNVILPTTSGCAVLGEKEVIHFNFNNGEVKTLPFPIDDFRTMKMYSVGDKNILILSMKDQLVGVDLEAGSILWQTPKEDETYEGYVHKYIKQNGNDVIVAYNRARLMSTESGTYIYCMSLNALTGKLNYKTPVLLSQATLTDFQRGLAKTITGAFAAFVAIGSAGIAAGQSGQAIDMVSDMMGYGKIGFDYNVFEYNENIIFESRTNAVMWNPETRDDPGEGYVSVNSKTGAINYKEFFEIISDLNPAQAGVMATPLYVDKMSYIPGEERLIAFDLSSGKRLWNIEGNEKLGFIDDLALIDGIVYVKFGKQEYQVSLQENSVKTNKPWDEDPYGVMAVDALDGKILWAVETEVDPALVTPQFSIQNYYSSAGKRLYFADEQNIYALKMGRDGGSYDWKFNFDDNKIGEMEYEKTFAVNERWIGSKVRTTTTTTNLGGGWALQTTSTSGGLDDEKTSEFYEDAAGSELSTTYTSWGNIWGVTAKRCLRVLYNGEMIVVFGPDGIGSIDINSGTANWVSEWDFDNEAVQFIPQIFGDRIIYCVDRELTLLDLKNGNQLWQVEEAKKPRFFTTPDETFFFSIDEEIISGYDLN